ncbi:MAG: UDP-glucose 4-epimerase GalE [Alphaproteobacteria bacterium]|nr:UDP-glucose 4-epimerase GalE [Alphaproteobacteria bacterium]
MKILLTGGAGYIGSHMAQCLLESGINVVILDNLSNGSRKAIEGIELVVGDIGDSAVLDRLFSAHKFDGVMHFASLIQVGESVTNPGAYFDNNIARTVTLLNKMVEYNIEKFIFSSTAAIFGNPQFLPIAESHPTQPVNPYGRSKLVIEQLLEDYHRAYGLNYGCLRYFNAAGAHPTIAIGECHEPETHLIPLILQVAAGRRDHIKIFGNDYDTADGTCIRDYIHVCDLADAHLLLFNALKTTYPTAHYNLGTGTGYSVQEVVATVEKVTNCPVAQKIEPRRAGDPAILIADGSAAQADLGWKPKVSDLETIIAHAWQWEQQYHVHATKNTGSN